MLIKMNKKHIVCIAFKRKVPRLKGSLSDLGKLFFMCWTMMGDWWPTLRVFIKLVRSTGRHGESSWDIWCRIGQSCAKNCRQCTLCCRPNQMLLSAFCSSPSVLIINISIKIVGQCTTVYSISWSRWYRSCCHQFWIQYYPLINPRAFCLLQCTQLYFYEICTSASTFLYSLLFRPVLSPFIFNVYFEVLQSTFAMFTVQHPMKKIKRCSMYSIANEKLSSTCLAGSLLRSYSSIVHSWFM